MKEVELLKIIFKDSPDILEPLNEIDKEIERLNNIIEKDKVLIKEANDRGYSEFEENVKLVNENSGLKFDNKKLHSIIKEVREYIEKELNIEKICRQEKSLTICKKGLLEILNKAGEE